MTGSQQRQDWIGEIARKSNESNEFVKEVMQQHAIRSSPSIGKPRRLIISHIRFSGRKKGKYTNSFDFSFRKLGYGLWGLISDKNLKGKTSILEVTRWLLRGKASGYLQEGVKSWIKKASLVFLIDKIEYRVELSQEEGRISGNLVEALVGREPIEICRFSSEDEFEASMSDFMMRQLSLDVTSAWRKSNSPHELGTVVSHDWAAISGVLFIRGNDTKAIFGDVVQDGLNNRLMGMYLGLPWIPTLSQLKVAAKRINHEEKLSSERQNFSRGREEAQRLRVESEISRYRAELRRLPSDKDVRKSMREAELSHTTEINAVRELNHELSNTKRTYAELNQEIVQEEKDLRNFKEAQAARAVFKQLEPTCCPHCQVSISDDRRLREIEESSCSICGENMTDSDSSDILEEQYQNRLNASKKALKEVHDTVRLTENRIDEHHNRALRYDAEYRRLEGELDNFDVRYELEKKISGLEFILSEYQEISDSRDIENSSGLGRERKVIKAALEETKRRIDLHQKDLLEEVSRKIHEYAVQFGITSITGVTLTRNPHLKIRKDGVETSYSKCTDGEKLRLKIASIMALVSIAEERGIGRHPGLILIDSPKTEEIVENDVEKLVGGLFNLTQRLPHLQIILATTSSNSILSNIDKNHRKYAEGDSFLW